MRRLILLSLLGSALACRFAQAQTKKEPLVEQVRDAIDRAKGYLLSTQRDGHWEADPINPLTFGEQKGGQTSLTLLALFNAGVPSANPRMKEGLRYLRGLESASVYVRSLQTLVFAEALQQEEDRAAREDYRKRIEANVQYLLKNRFYRDKEFLGWSYRDNPIGADNSNTQFAMLGLWAGRQAGVDIPERDWKEIRDFYLRTQHKEGAWGYRSYIDPSSLTMTTAGLGGLLIAAMELNLPCEVTEQGRTRTCGDYADSEATGRAMTWLSRNFTLEPSQKTYYHIYGLERTGRLTGERFFGQHDWYREGCAFLVKEQREDGSFRSSGLYDKWPVVSTSFALLFLSKGRTPVLVSKLVHFNRSRKDDLDWNNDRNDLRNLVAFTSKEVFKGMPLAWQSFDVLRPMPAAPSEEDIANVTAELLQSPILYITGHQSPLGRLTTLEKQVLRRFVEGGGTIIAEACCGSKVFDEGFRKLLEEELFPGNDLSELPEDHPVWTSHFTLKQRDPYPLYGLSIGCRWAVLYSPHDLSCFWEANLLKDGRGDRAFKLGANMLAYATGKDPPRPRLTEVEVVRGKDEKKPFVPGSYLKAAQLRFRGGDWRHAPLAMRNLMDHVNRHAGVHVVRESEVFEIHSTKLPRHKFLYLHGRGKLPLPEEGLETLAFNLETGSLLFAAASCGDKEFDESFRAFAKALFPKAELEPVPADDLLYSKKLGGIELTAKTIRGRLKAGAEPRDMDPLLEGVRIDGRWVILYSKLDIGCALEKHLPGNCPGYTPESALRLATAAVLYTFWPGGEEGK